MIYALQTNTYYQNSAELLTHTCINGMSHCCCWWLIIGWGGKTQKHKTTNRFSVRISLLYSLRSVSGVGKQVKMDGGYHVQTDFFVLFGNVSSCILIRFSFSVHTNHLSPAMKKEKETEWRNNSNTPTPLPPWKHILLYFTYWTRYFFNSSFFRICATILFVKCFIKVISKDRF